MDNTSSTFSFYVKKIMEVAQNQRYCLIDKEFIYTPEIIELTSNRFNKIMVTDRQDRVLTKSHLQKHERHTSVTQDANYLYYTTELSGRTQDQDPSSVLRQIHRLEKAHLQNFGPEGFLGDVISEVTHRIEEIHVTESYLVIALYHQEHDWKVQIIDKSNFHLLHEFNIHGWEIFRTRFYSTTDYLIVLNDGHGMHLTIWDLNKSEITLQKNLSEDFEIIGLSRSLVVATKPDFKRNLEIHFYSLPHFERIKSTTVPDIYQSGFIIHNDIYCLVFSEFDQHKPNIQSSRILQISTDESTFGQMSEFSIEISSLASFFRTHLFQVDVQ